MNTRKILLMPLFLAAAFFTAGCDSTPVRWQYTFEKVNGDAVWDSDAVKFVFKDVAAEGAANVSLSGSVLVGGPGHLLFNESLGSIKLHSSYDKGRLTVTMQDKVFEITDSGKKLTVAGQTFDLSGPKKTIVIAPDGKATLQESSL